ncbi:MAG: 5'/3'-nucleotidase SurE [Anaerolineaceae bacterium]|nr:5'/3'-nucleotidase SurE [Anaerolineaceae bacterium]
MHILVTNDDGVSAPSLLALAQAMRNLGKVTILAPDRNWSVSGHVKTLDRPLRVEEVQLSDGSTAFASDGSPSDCVALALLGYVKDPIDIVVAGINPYPNLGYDLTYSGTVTAAMEAVILGKPGIAFSMESPKGTKEPVDYRLAGKIAAQITRTVADNGLPSDILLNVNIPNPAPEDFESFQVTRQGKRIYRDKLVSRIDPMGRPYHWIGGDVPSGIPEKGTDIGALAAGHVSIMPIYLDLTAEHFIKELQDWDWSNEKGEK